MSWNRPTEKKVEKKSKQKNVRLMGLFVAAVVVACAVVAWLWVDGNRKAVRHADANSSLIADKGTKTPRKAVKVNEQAARAATKPTKMSPTSNVADTTEQAAAPAETNAAAPSEKKEKDTRPFKNIMNQLLAMVMPKNPGEMIPPLPLAEEMRFTDEQEREMLKQLTVEEHDTAETIKRKELVQSLQDEYFELKKRGWTFVDYLKALQAKVNLDAEVMQESFKIYKGIFDDPNISDEKYKETLDSINKVLTDRGLKPIEPTASGLPEDEEGNIIYETDAQTTTEETQK